MSTINRSKMTEFRKELIEIIIKRDSIFSDSYNCILWKGVRTGNRSNPVVSYGHMGGTFRINVSQYILEKKLGRDVREGYKVLHTCDNIHGSCINEDHLYEGTHEQNMKDMTDRNREANGERNGNAILTEFEVYDIARDLNLGYSGASLGRKYGVTRYAISDIKRRKSWKRLLEGYDLALQGACS